MRGRKIKMVVYSVLTIVGVAVLAVVILFAYKSATSRRPDNLGVQAGRLAACPASPNCVCSQDDDAAHHVEPFSVSGARPIEELAAAIATMPRAKVISSTDNYLHAEFTSLIFRFVDDVEFFVDPATKVVHCRSASRTGYSDLGVNRKRIEAIRKALAERAASPAH